MKNIDRMTEPWLSYARSAMNVLNDHRIMILVFQSTMVSAFFIFIAFHRIRTLALKAEINVNDVIIFLVFSFQDTLIGHEALSRYALNEKNRFIYTMEITIESTFVPGWNYTVTFDPKTWMKIHYIEIPDARGQVKANAKGTGYAVMMVGSIR